MKMLASIISASALWISTGGSTLLADPISVTSIPEATKWVMHLDVDAGRNSALEELVNKRLIEPQKVMVETRLDQLKRITGMQFPQDCHDVTLYGSNFDEASVCVMIHGALKPALVMAFLKTNGQFSNTPYNGKEILQWRETDRNRMMYGAFQRDDLAIISADQKAVERALDVLNARTAALKPDSPLIPLPPDPGDGVHTILYLAAAGLPDLQRAARTDSPFLDLMDAAQFSLGVRDRDITARAAVLSKTDKAAQQMAAVAEGIKSFLTLAADVDRAPARAKLAATAIQNLTVKAEGKALKCEWYASKENLDALVTAVMQDVLPAPATNLAAPPSLSLPIKAP